MANEYDYEGGGGSGFMMGLLTGTVLGAGLGMLFAPKSGSELRGQLSETASRMGNAASENYQKVADKATDLAQRGREMGRDVTNRAREAVARGSEEAKRFGSDVNPSGSTGPSGSSSSSSGSMPGSPYSSGSDRK
jgi:gas vesicle protein